MFRYYKEHLQTKQHYDTTRPLQRHFASMQFEKDEYKALYFSPHVIEAIYVPLDVERIRVKIVTTSFTVTTNFTIYEWYLDVKYYREPSLEEILKESKQLPCKRIDMNKGSDILRRMVEETIVVDDTTYKRVVPLYPYFSFTDYGTTGSISLDRTCKAYLSTSSFDRPPKEVFTSYTEKGRKVVVLVKKDTECSEKVKVLLE